MKVFLNSVGCRLNQAEIEKYGNQLVQLGNELVDSAELADIVILNTCAVTGPAASDSRSMIRHAARSGPDQLIVTGCFATLEPDTVREIDPESWIIHNSVKDQLIEKLNGNQKFVLESEQKSRLRIPGPRYRTRSFVKIQDGCDYHCTYCITRIARGKSRSILQGEIVKDIQIAEASGIKEVILTGVQLGGWGKDLKPKQRLSDLINLILEQTHSVRIRLSSLEPWDINDEFIELFQNQRICSQLHFPLQSGSNKILRSMGRINTAESFEKIIHQIRKIDPDIAITTDILVGFPGETETDFQESSQFITHIGFSGGHVFSYSPRIGTPAEQMHAQIPQHIKKERVFIIQKILENAQSKYFQNFLNKNLHVLWESVEKDKDGLWNLKGLSENYIPVISQSKENLYNLISTVHVNTVCFGEVKGEIIE